MHKTRKGNAKYPLATVALYGPDDRRTTKVVIGVFQSEKSEPVLYRLVSSDFQNDAKLKNDIVEILKKNKVQQSTMTSGNIGCIHEEGQDYPIGEDCPFCPFWKGKQGSNAR